MYVIFYETVFVLYNFTVYIMDYYCTCAVSLFTFWNLIKTLSIYLDVSVHSSNRSDIDSQLCKPSPHVTPLTQPCRHDLTSTLEKTYLDFILLFRLFNV